MLCQDQAKFELCNGLDLNLTNYSTSGKMYLSKSEIIAFKETFKKATQLQ